MSETPATFVHLSVHTEYSIVDSTLRIKPLFKRVAESMPAVAITDLHNLFALVRAWRAALSAGVKPLVGAELRVVESAESKEFARLIVLAQNQAGYSNLTRLISQSFQEGQHTLGVPTIQRAWLEQSHEGLIVLSGGLDGDVAQLLARGRLDEAEARVRRWQALLGDRYYLELQRIGRRGESALIEQSVRWAAEFGIGVVATNPVRFLDADGFAAHEARECIQAKRVLADPNRPRSSTEQQYLKSAEEMIELFADIPSAIENTLQIAQRCNIELHLGQSVLPDFPIPEGHDETGWFRALARQGLEARLQRLHAQADDGQSLERFRQPYDQRLTRELEVIGTMGFAGYFLIVADFIQWSRDNGIPVGPGRGSGAGSLVAYALGITDIDPLAYDLLFERFLNPERVSMPDFDIDFCMDGRDRVIQYVAQKYGAHRVSQIITYGTMAAKAVVRDVGRIMSHPFPVVDRMAKMVPDDLGITLEKALAESDELARAVREEEEVAAVFEMARSLEGLTRSCGKHAGGVVIAPTALTDFAPLYCESDGSSLVTQFDKDDAEAVGLVKFDFLGLRTLTIIDNAVRSINARRDQPLVIEDLPLNDEATFSLLQQASTTAVFQLESDGMKRLIERLQPNSFEDIIALVALFRPGPLDSGMVDDFIDRKHGRKPLAWPHENYQLESLRPVLEPTYGVILYQEQVMQIAQVMAGYSLGAADLLRRAMGKKKPEEMAKQRAVFLKGSVAQGIDADLAGNIFDLVEKFAGYGFNKSHSAAYALLSYQTAWLKTHYPAEFMASVLSADMDTTDKVVVLVNECRRMGLAIQPPDINRSALRFSVPEANVVLYGLGAIKGVGGAALNEVLLERDRNGPFESLEQLCRRVPAGTVSKGVLEALIKAGALDALGPNRRSLWDGIAPALKAAEQYHRDQQSGQADMFGLLEVEQPVIDSIAMREWPEWPERDRLRAEKGVLGLYLSGHPITEYLTELERFTRGRLDQLCRKAAQGVQPAYGGRGRPRGVAVVAAGLLTRIRVRDSRAGRFAVLAIDDDSASLEVTLRGEVLDDALPRLEIDEVYVVEGDIAPDEYNGGYSIRAREIMDMAAARARFARRLSISLDGRRLERECLEALLSTLQAHRTGTTPVRIAYTNAMAEVEIQAGRYFCVAPGAELIEQLGELVGRDSVALEYSDQDRLG